MIISKMNVAHYINRKEYWKCERALPKKISMSLNDKVVYHVNHLKVEFTTHFLSRIYQHFDIFLSLIELICDAFEKLVPQSQ